MVAFADLWNNYPSDDTPCRDKSGNVPAGFENQCAIPNDINLELVPSPSRYLMGRPVVRLSAGFDGALLAYPMKRALWALAFAILGVMVCIGVQLLTAATGFAPRFPAFAGEDDFDLRFRYFLFMVCPAFALLGAWIGSAFGHDRRAGGFMWLGVIAGSLITFLVARSLASAISDLSTRAAANRGVLLLFLGWIALAALGAYGGRSLVARR